jgi:sortase A
MPRQRSVEDLSSDELRQLLVEKRREERESRLKAYRKTGRVIRVDGDETPSQSFSEVESQQETSEPTSLRQRARARRKTGLDRLLFGVEIVAILGLFFIIFNGAKLLANLNQEFASALDQPNLTPTALITAVVLPSGHTPPVEGMEVRPNDAEIPEHLRPLMQSYSNLPIPTPGPQQARQIQIAAIGVNAPVVMGDGWEQLKKGVAQHLGTANPGEQGNMVVSAHNDIFGELFKDLDKLVPGDTIVVLTQDRTFTYTVTGTQIVEPNRVDVMAQTSETTLTLISCYPYRVDNKRIVVSAILQQN